MKVKVKVLVSRVGPFVTPMTVDYQAYLSMDSPGNNTGVDSESLLHGIFPTQELNQVSCISGTFFTVWAIREAPIWPIVNAQ